MKIRVLNEMAFEKDKAIENVKKLSNTLKNHIIKCVAYNDTVDVNHWIGEIANYLTEAGSVKLKTKSGKLSANEYSKALFSDFGETFEDAKIVVKIFVYSGEDKEFEVTDFIVNKILEFKNNIKSATINMLSSKKEYEKADYVKVIKDCFEKL